MPFTAHDLRYHAEQSYPLLYAYLHRNAQRHLGSLQYDAFEVDTVIGHVVEQLVRLGLLGGGDHTSLGALDRLTDAQFYAFLHRSVRNKAIDRLRKRRLSVSTAAELESIDEDESTNPLNSTVESLWGTTPFSTPEDITLFMSNQHDLRALLKHCIMLLHSAPYQLQAIIQELNAIGADDLLKNVLDELKISLVIEQNPHMSQHKDHAHKKLRSCLQQQSSNLTVIVALRLTVYTQHAANAQEYAATLESLAQQDMTLEDVREGLQGLVREGLLDWQGEESVRLTSAQLKRLSRFYKEE